MSFFLLENKTDIVYDNSFIKFIEELKYEVLEQFSPVWFGEDSLCNMHEWIKDYVIKNKHKINCNIQDKEILCNKPNLFVINFCLLIHDLNQYKSFEEINLTEIRNNCIITCAAFLHNNKKKMCACGKMVIPSNITYIRCNGIQLQFGDTCIEKIKIISKKEIKKIKLNYIINTKWDNLINKLIKDNKNKIINKIMKQVNEYRICIDCLEVNVPKINPHWFKICVGCYIKKKTNPFNKCMINIKKT